MILWPIDDVKVQIHDVILNNKTLIKRLSEQTWRTGVVTRNFSRNALGERSYLRQVAKWSTIESMSCRGCCRVIRRYFCSGLAIVGKMAWAVSNGVKGVDGAAKRQYTIEISFDIPGLKSRGRARSSFEIWPLQMAQEEKDRPLGRLISWPLSNAPPPFIQGKGKCWNNFMGEIIWKRHTFGVSGIIFLEFNWTCRNV